MKPKTKTLLLRLSEEHSRASLVGLWQDLSKLSREQFETSLDAMKGKPPPKPSGRKKSVQPMDDHPVTRIAHQLRNRLSLPDEVAMTKLSDALISKGVRSDLIP